MIIDTQRKVIAIQLRRLIVMICYIIILLIILFFLDEKKKHLGMNLYQLGFGLTGLYIVYLIIEGFCEFKYIYFNDEAEKILLRYFSLGYLNRKKESIEIPKNDFVNYTIRNSFFGLKKKIVLIRSVKTKEAKYPPVSLTILTKNQIEKVKSALDRYRKS
jgi:hypothetical protein